MATGRISTGLFTRWMTANTLSGCCISATERARPWHSGHLRRVVGHGRVCLSAGAHIAAGAASSFGPHRSAPPYHPLGLNDIFSSFAALPPHRRVPGAQTLPPALFPLCPDVNPAQGKAAAPQAVCHRHHQMSPNPNLQMIFPLGQCDGTPGHRDTGTTLIVLSRLSRLSRHRNPAENCGLAVKNSVSTRHTVNRTCLGRLV